MYLTVEADSRNYTRDILAKSHYSYSLDITVYKHCRRTRVSIAIYIHLLWWIYVYMGLSRRRYYDNILHTAYSAITFWIMMRMSLSAQLLHLSTVWWECLSNETMILSFFSLLYDLNIEQRMYKEKKKKRKKKRKSEWIEIWLTSFVCICTIMSFSIKLSLSQAFIDCFYLRTDIYEL